MQVQLIVANKSQKGQVIPVDVPAFRIGQSEDCHLRSNSSRISQQHCAIHTHDDTVTVQDLGSKNGTFVNGKKISSPKQLKDGDELTVGRHSFTVSIEVTAAQSVASPHEAFELVSDSAVRSSAEPERDTELMFEVQYKRQSISVTKQRLFDLARTGDITPDCVITVADTKVYADTVQGIVFGKESPAVGLPTNHEAKKTEFYTVAASGAIPPAVVPSIDTTSPFDTADEPSVQVARVPGAREEMTFSNLGKPLEKPLNRVSAWVGDNVTSRHVKIVVAILAALCLLGIVGAWHGASHHTERFALRERLR